MTALSREPASGNRTRIELSSLYNADLAPTAPARRTWTAYSFAALWVAMCINITTYLLGSSLVQGGMNWSQAVLTVLVGTLIVMIPMLLNSHPGTKYGIPFPVLVRAPFGVLGANIPASIRALVACGWFGIQTWIGGQAIHTLLATLWPAWQEFSYGGVICFAAFWLINLAVILKGMEYVRLLQGFSAPILLVVSLMLFAWAYTKAGGLDPMLSAPSRFENFPDFLKFFVPGVNAAVGYWATLSLNISDFSRFARSQRDQILGQSTALPLSMTLYALISIAVTSSTLVIYGGAIWDPIELFSRFDSPLAVAISLLAILLAVLNLNIGANVVSPANDFSNLWPRMISFRTGGIITCVIGLFMMPWKLMETYETFLVGWVGGYSALMGPVAGIMICDYHLIRKRILEVEDLFLRGGCYEYHNGFNWRAIVALLFGVAVALVGLAVPPLRFLFDYSWFVGFGSSFLAHYFLMCSASTG